MSLALSEADIVPITIGTASRFQRTKETNEWNKEATIRDYC